MAASADMPNDIPNDTSNDMFKEIEALLDNDLSDEVDIDNKADNTTVADNINDNGAVDATDDIKKHIERVIAIDVAPAVPPVEKPAAERPKIIRKKAAAPPKKKTNFDDSNNLSIKECFERYSAPISTDEDKIVTPPILTTTTTVGMFENLTINEEKDIGKFVADEHVVMIKSNYGCTTYDNYVVPKKEKTSKRGRKKTEKKVKKSRKRQGTGECFNSQISFTVLHNGGLYKFKVFRDGIVQLPGVTPKKLPDVIAACKYVADSISKALTGGEREIKLKGIYPNMNNYKFYLRMEQGQKIFLTKLNTMLKIEQMRDHGVLDKYMKGGVCNCELRDCIDCYQQAILKENAPDKRFEPPEHPKIADVKYTLSRSCLSVRFATPVAGNAQKHLLLKIYPGTNIERNYDAEKQSEPDWGGKMNIQGGLDEKTTRQVYEYMNAVFEYYYDDVVGYEGENADEDSEYEYVIEDECVDNIYFDEHEDIWEECEKTEKMRVYGGAGADIREHTREKTQTTDLLANSPINTVRPEAGLTFVPNPAWKIYVRGVRAKRMTADPAFAIDECVVNACSSGKEPFKSSLSPFFVGPITLPWGLHADAPCAVAHNLENAWQFAKVYSEHLDPNGNPTDAWRAWADEGFRDAKAHRFPMGRGAKPEYAFGGYDKDGGVRKWGYVESRYRLYAPLYAAAIRDSEGFKQCVRLLEQHGQLTILDFDGWDHAALGLTLSDVMYYPNKKMGHGFVIAMLLTGVHPWEDDYGGEERIAATCAKVLSSKKSKKTVSS